MASRRFASARRERGTASTSSCSLADPEPLLSLRVPLDSAVIPELWRRSLPVDVIAPRSPPRQETGPRAACRCRCAEHVGTAQSMSMRRESPTRVRGALFVWRGPNDDIAGTR
ncbi:hypothetical protein C9J85_16805 [Haloferax sp. wsp5]|nr:hypothetical protein C9J85_16805 [Haloferax sp. wsp5]